jgi:hypothetical protein
MNPQQSPGPANGRRRLVLASAALVVLTLAVTGILFAAGGDEDARPAGASGTSASTSVPVAATAPPSATSTTSPTPTEPLDGNELPPSQAAVALDAVATADSGVSASLAALEAIQGTGAGPGSINGPALRVTVRITNGTSDALDLDQVQVTMSHGDDETPASPLNDPSVAPFTGTLAAGASAEGRYVFSVPEGRRDMITVTVGYLAGAPFLVFTGSAD